MCGIIGIVGRPQAAQAILEGLKRLEYRGYDSAGVATLINGHIQRRRTKGKLANLVTLLETNPLEGSTGIGHTRWATHGMPTAENAHPHANEHVAVVHNGIIENFSQLRQEMENKGYQFTSDTDTEVVVHLITDQLLMGHEPMEAVKQVLKRLDGAFALAIIFAGHDDLMIGAKHGSPLAIGHGIGETYLGSDALSLAPLTQRISYLEDGDWVVIQGDSVQIYDTQNAPVDRLINTSAYTGALIGKGNYRHFMLKEIHEQPTVFGNTIQSLLDATTNTLDLPEMLYSYANAPRVTIVACGTSYYAGLVAKYWIERWARLGVDIDIASEFRYRQPPLPQDGIAIFISQSGETADTLAALKYAKQQGQCCVALVNVLESSIARESDVVMQTFAGPEIGVASTKAFTVQLMVLAAFAIGMGRARNFISIEEEQTLVRALLEIPAHMAELLSRAKEFEQIAHQLAIAQDILYIGRSLTFPIAMEGALKLKELSYIHAEGYAAGELKHGPIALIDDRVPIIALAPTDATFEKTISNVHEVMARNGQVILLTDQAGKTTFGEKEGATIITLPQVHPFVSPILYAIPVQLLAYYTAVIKGTDVDQPRNLAKSVTVE